jgi:ABC-type multidrug transport system fused ATPase/permease subunit
MWAFNVRHRRRNMATGLLMFVSLGVAYAVVADAVVHRHTTLAVETAVFAAALAVFGAVAGSFDALEVEGAMPVLDAAARLRAELGTAPRSLSQRRPAGVRQRDAPPAAPPKARAPVVALSGIRFAYPGAERVVLDGLDLTIHSGELLAIVGLNGAGKSTLIKLLAGLYEPDAGRITMDGEDIRDLGVDTWRQYLSVVFQDFVRYPLSAADNVELGNAVVDLDAVARDRAAADAGLDQVLSGLPDGWGTPLSRTRSGGVDLSGGQWQQVALARALYAVHTGARLLVLDEPTAHLDVRSELEFFNRLVDRPGEASVVLISHRLATVRRADRIVLLEGGRVTESGTHDELMRLDGRYAEMFRIQAERFNRGYDDRADEELA